VPLGTMFGRYNGATALCWSPGSTFITLAAGFIIGAVSANFPHLQVNSSVRPFAIDYYNDSHSLEYVLARNCRLESLWMNHGLEESGKPLEFIPDRAETMARKFASFASLSAEDRFVVDLGPGYGDQDFLFMREHAVQSIVGINYASLQNHIANLRAEHLGFNERLTFRDGDGKNLYFILGSSVDKVLSLDAVMHWTRTHEDSDAFLGEVRRILKPHGKLVMTDFVWKDDVDYEVAPANSFYPVGGGYTLEGYKQSLFKNGFGNIHVEELESSFTDFRHQSDSALSFIAKLVPLSLNWRIAVTGDLQRQSSTFEGMRSIMVRADKM